MAKINIFNSLTRQKEEFNPIDRNNIKIYVCGPTVYDRPHLGNARSIVIYDLWFRLFSKLFPKVTYVRNITDVDDKINDAAIKKGVSIKSLTTSILHLFYQDINALNVLSPTFEPKATDHIKEMIIMIEKLIANGNAYQRDDHILFDVNSFKDYGQLSNRIIKDLIAGARVEEASYKKNPLDFVLWKPADKDDDQSSIFESPWGKGRPGWHIECSAMSNKYLGEDFDIHGGGADLQFPHHENEIAQSKCANKGSNYAKYWVHNGFLTVNGEKMSKSLNNFFTIKDLLDKNINPLAIRYLLLFTHYRKPLDFNEKALDDATKSIDKFYKLITQYKLDLNYKNNNNPYLEEIITYLSDDLNTSLAFSVLHKIIKDIKETQRSNNDIIPHLIANLIECLEFLGLYNSELICSKNTNVDENYILEKIKLRKEAKLNKDWAKADSIRQDLLSLGVIIKDNKDGKVDWYLDSKS